MWVVEEDQFESLNQNLPCCSSALSGLPLIFAEVKFTFSVGGVVVVFYCSNVIVIVLALHENGMCEG